jgi:hypothetical protein
MNDNPRCFRIETKQMPMERGNFDPPACRSLDLRNEAPADQVLEAYRTSPENQAGDTCDKHYSDAPSDQEHLPA